MIRGFLLAIGVLRAVLLSRADLLLENLALRQQLAAFARNGQRPHIVAADRLFWLALRRLWLRSSDVLVLVKPLDSGPLAPSQFSSLLDLALGAPPMRPTADRCPSPRIDTSAGVGEPNLACAAHPRRAAHARLRSLGAQRVEVSSSTATAFWRTRALADLRNHRGAIAAMDFFTVPTATFRVLYVWFAIVHSQRRVLHFDVTEHPTASWVVQQLREAFPYDTAPHPPRFRPRRHLQRLGRLDSGVTRHPASQNGIPQSVAERRCGALDRECSDANSSSTSSFSMSATSDSYSGSTSPTITTTEPILRLPRRLPLGAGPWCHAKHTLPWWPYLDLADCIIATTLRPESPHRLATELVQLRKRDERMIDNHLPGVGKTH